MGAHCAPLRKKKSSAVLLFEAVAALRFSPDYPKGKGVIHKRVETLVSTLLCPRRVGGPRWPQRNHLKTRNRIYKEKTL